MNKTKRKILEAAIDLFDEKGFVNVRNQDIAEKAGISLSNFNYHFGNKKDLVETTFAYLSDVLNIEVYGQSFILSKENQGLEIAASYFEFEKRFRFFYLDTYNILQFHPELRELFKKQVEEAIQLIKNINFLAIGKGFLKAPPPDMPQLYDQLAQQIWINNHFWFAQMEIRGLKGDIRTMGLSSNFYIVYPYLTESGIENFKQFIEMKKR